MRPPGDYVGEMALSVTEEEAEALLSRSGTVGEDLLDVAVILEAVRNRAIPKPDEEFTHLFEAAVRESRLSPIERFANQQVMITDDWKPRVAKRLAIGALVLVAFAASSTGFAGAANGSIPGDLLYGVDLALERVGIGDGGADERLAEAQALVAGGAVADESTTTTQAIQPTDNASSIAIAEAAARIADGPVVAADNVAVQALLDYIHGQHEKGEMVDGAMVSEMARQIGNRPVSPGNSENAPGQDPAGPPGHQNTEDPAITGEDGDAPGNSENAPGRDPEGTPGQVDGGTPGNSENAPGRDPEGTPGQQDKTNAPATGSAGDTEDAPGNSENAPGQGGANPGNEPSGGGPPGQGGG